MNCFTKPQLKRHYYISRTDTPIISNIVDCKIKSILKLNNNLGYSMKVCVNQDDKKCFNDIDELGIANLISNNSTWFQNSLSEEDIRKLFRYAVCEQSNSITFIINYNTKIYINNKTCELADFISHDMAYFRKCMLNVKVQHIGLCIYSKQTYNRWYANTIHIYDEEIDIEDKEDIEDTWSSLISEANEKLNTKIQYLENTKSRINMLYEHIQKNHRNREWDAKIQELKKIIQNIIF